MAIDHDIEIHIDELVLYGFPNSERHHISSALEAELARLFTERGLPLSLLNGGEIQSLNAGAFQSSSQLKGMTVGAQTANKVYSAFTEPLNNPGKGG